jgi:hypothetical protein
MIAAYLAKAGERVTLMDPWFAHVVAMQDLFNSVEQLNLGIFLRLR